MIISVITINYNNRDGLLKTIRSVISQTWRSVEFIIIDGGSTDGSVEIIKQYINDIDFWVSEPDKGIYHAMNKGIDQAHGEYCLFLNSGDILHDNKVLERIIGDLTTDVVIGAIKKATSGYVKRLNLREPLALLDFWFENPIPHQSTFIRRSVCARVRYDESLRIAGDLKFFLQIIVMNGCSHRSSDCIVADFDETGISSQQGADEEWLKIFADILPPYIFADYQKLLHRNYDSFYAKLRLRKYYKIIYTLSVLGVRLISVFRPTARFVKKFPYLLR